MGERQSHCNHICILEQWHDQYNKINMPTKMPTMYVGMVPVRMNGEPLKMMSVSGAVG
jgi:hypothetical protein